MTPYQLTTQPIDENHVYVTWRHELKVRGWVMDREKLTAVMAKVEEVLIEEGE